MKTNRSWIGAVALISFLALPGAKVEGCGGTVEPEPEPEPTPCPLGEHLEEVCWGEDAPAGDGVPGSRTDCVGGCEQVCVPDEVCPDGTVEQTVCDGETYPVASSPECRGEYCVEPPPENCWTECVPIDPCGEGYREEWVCEPWPRSDDADAEPPPPPEECYPICVADDCLAPAIPVEVCVALEGGMTECWTECQGDLPPPEAS